MKRPKKRPPFNEYSQSPPSRNRTSALSEGLNYTLIAICAGIFMLGIGAGILLSSNQTVNSANIASREVIDRSAPNPELCVQYGASAIVSNLRVFITLNPFNVYVTQPSMRPGCVLRKNNWSILEQQRLVTDEQVKDCKNRMNTFGYTGPLEGSPNIECIYQNNAAGNLFLNPSSAINPKETENF
jgi:hypothetical protein